MVHTFKVKHPRTASDAALRSIVSRFTAEILGSQECRQYLTVEQAQQMEEGLIDAMDVLPHLCEEMLIPFGEESVKTIEVDFSNPSFAKV